MNPSASKVAQLNRWRGVMLEMVYKGLSDQNSRLDDITLWGMMQDFGHGIGLNQARACLQHLRECGCLRFAQTKNNYTGETEVSKIEITARGIAVAEKRDKDDSILIL